MKEVFVVSIHFCSNAAEPERVILIQIRAEGYREGTGAWNIHMKTLGSRYTGQSVSLSCMKIYYNDGSSILVDVGTSAARWFSQVSASVSCSAADLKHKRSGGSPASQGLFYRLLSLIQTSI